MKNVAIFIGGFTLGSIGVLAIKIFGLLLALKILMSVDPMYYMSGVLVLCLVILFITRSKKFTDTENERHGSKSSKLFLNGFISGIIFLVIALFIFAFHGMGQLGLDLKDLF